MRDLFGFKRTIPIGVEFGTVGVLDTDGRMHEVTTFRRDVRTDGRHAEVEFGVSLDDDLARRDFTINAMAYSPVRDELRDLFGGQSDISKKLIRAVGDPDARMREDRLRALRAIRFAARFGFSIDPPTRAAIESSAAFLGRLSRERVKQELDKTMEQVRCPSEALLIWQSSGAFESLIPQLHAMAATSLTVPDRLAIPGPPKRPARRSLRYAGLFTGLSAKDAERILISLKASKNEIQWITALVDKWRRLGREMGESLAIGVPADMQVRRWVAAIGRLDVGAFMRLAAAVWGVGGDGQAPTLQSVRRLYRRMLEIALRDPIDLASLAIDGDDLRRAGIPPGRSLGMILRWLLETVIDDPAKNTADYLLQEAQRHSERLQHDPGVAGPGQET